MKTMNVNFSNSEYIILGLKDKDDNLYLYESSLSKTTIAPVKINDSIRSTFSVFPFNVFSSLDNDKIVGYERIYLKVRLIDKLSLEQIKNLRESGLTYYRFPDREMIILGEFNEPFQYSLEMLKSKPGNLTTYNLTTWLIHEEARDSAEFKAMECILDIALNQKAITEYPLDLSLDRHVLKYLPLLANHKHCDSVTFGKYGSLKIDEADIKRGDKEGFIKSNELSFLIDKLGLEYYLFYHSEFSTDFIVNYLSLNKNNAYKTQYLEKFEVKELSNVGIDMDKLFTFHYNTTTKLINHAREYGKVFTLDELMSDESYEPLMRVSDPYEYYCCPDCDGYELEDDELESYEYEEDQQVQTLHIFVGSWKDYLTDISSHYFSTWSKDIFSRYMIEYGENKFIRSLIK